LTKVNVIIVNQSLNNNVLKKQQLFEAFVFQVLACYLKL